MANKKTIKLDYNKIGSFLRGYKEGFQNNSSSSGTFEEYAKGYMKDLHDNADHSCFAEEWTKFDETGKKLPYRVIYPCPSEKELAKLKKNEDPSKFKTPENRIEWYECPRLSNGTYVWMDTVDFDRGFYKKPEATMYVDFGYIDGERGATSPFQLGGTGTVHMFVNGDTGSGKSVFTNNFIVTSLLRYSPYDINLYMSDAKITEYKLYAEEMKTSHIKAVAAAKDQSYVVTLVSHLVDIMEKRLGIFGRYNAKNVLDFRREWNLDMPLVIYYCEEFQAMFKKTTSKEKNALLKYLDIIGSQGRSAGVLMCLVSQNLQGDIPKTVIDQVGLRAALKMANDSNSEKILGNPSASKIPRRGISYVNGDVSTKDPNEDIHFHSGYMPPKEFKKFGGMLQDLCAKENIPYNCDYYNEDIEYTKDLHFEDLKSMRPNVNRIYLGTMGYFSTELNKCYKINLKTLGGGEHFVLASPTDKGLLGIYNQFENNFSRLDSYPRNRDVTKAIHRTYINCADDLLAKRMNLKDKVKEGCRVFDVSSSRDDRFEGQLKVPLMVAFLSKVDQAILDREGISINQKLYNPDYRELYKSTKEYKSSKEADEKDGSTGGYLDEYFADRETFWTNIKTLMVESGLNMNMDLFVRRITSGIALLQKDNKTFKLMNESLKPDKFKTDTRELELFISWMFSTYRGCSQSRIGDVNLRIDDKTIPVSYLILCGMSNLDGVQIGTDNRRVLSLMETIMDLGRSINFRLIILTKKFREISQFTKKCEYTIVAQMPSDTMAKYKSAVPSVDTSDVLGSVLLDSTSEQIKYKIESLDDFDEGDDPDYISEDNQEIPEYLLKANLEVMG